MNTKRAVHPPPRRAMELHLILSRMTDKEWEEWLDGYRAGVACQEILKDFMKMMETERENRFSGQTILVILEGIAAEVDEKLPNTVAGLVA